eukprot:COSAG01_NODE_71165_length_256_cov_2.108280_1_plen_75_part_10
MGYRWYDSQASRAPLWAFGFGLGWVHWTWNDLQVVGTVTATANATVTATLSNYYGTQRAQTIVQLYVRFPAAAEE